MSTQKTKSIELELPTGKVEDIGHISKYRFIRRKRLHLPTNKIVVKRNLVLQIMKLLSSCLCHCQFILTLCSLSGKQESAHF